MRKNHRIFANAALHQFANAPHRAVENAEEKKVGSGGMAATFGLSVRRARFELLDGRDPGVGDGDRHRRGRALGWRDQRSGRRDLEPLNRMRQDALRRAGLLDDVTERAIFAVPPMASA
jgi:hypothetical protein